MWVNTLTPTTYFQGVRTPTLRDLRPLFAVVVIVLRYSI